MISPLRFAKFAASSTRRYQLPRTSSATSFNCSRYVHHIRNVGVVAHIDAGKTTTSEQMLYVSGHTQSIGRVDTGDTVMDFLPQERERGITISSAAISFKWKDQQVNLIDTPGHVDFTIEVERSARVLDGAVVVVDAVSGVQAQTRTVWKQTKKQQIPAVAFVNKMDRDGASFERSVDSIQKKLGANAVPIQLPIGSEDTFTGVVDLISMSTIVWDNAYSSSRSPKGPVVSSLSEDDALYPDATAARRAMVESVAELDEDLMESYLASDGEDITADHLLPAIRRACLKGDMIPTLCGASLRCKGVEPLLDSILAFLPSPHDRPPCIAVSNKGGGKKRISVDSNDLCALAFKIVHDPARGPLVFVRVYSGTLSSKQTLYNSTRGSRERINQLLLVSADDLDTIPSIGAGCVACIVGLKGTVTGDTLVADKGPLQSYVLDGLHVPPAVFSLAVEPERSSQQPELEAALAILCVEDPSLRIEVDKESGQTILRGIGELHLEIVCDKLRRQFNIEVTTGKAYVNYRESLFSAMGTVVRTHTYDRTLGTKRMYAAITFEVTAKESAEEPDIEVADAVKKQATPDELVSIVEGLKASFSRGPLGFPVTGVSVKVTQLDRDQDTTSGAVRACISLFIDSLLRSDDRALLEPIMAMEIELPTAFMGEVLSDLTVKRRGQVKDVVTRDGSCTITADVPLATMLGYATAIRSMTQGEGNFSMEYDRHTAVDLAIAQEYLSQ